MKSAFEVSQYMLKLSSPECGDFISNHKMQKLLYYAQGTFLALHDKPLFPEELYKWDYGPAVPEVYQHYREHFPDDVIPIPYDFDGLAFSKKKRKVIDEVLFVFGQFSAWKLRDMTIHEKPWLWTKKGQVISKDLIGEYFRKSVLV